MITCICPTCIVLTTESQLSSTAPRLLHLTAGAQASIISSFASLATTFVHLRKFTSAIFEKASTGFVSSVDADSQSAYLAHSQRRSTRTLEAFADALDTELRAFDAWCAQREEDICQARAGLGPKLVVSLLSLEKAIRDEFGASFAAFFDTVSSIVRSSQRLSSEEPTPYIWTLPDLPQRTAPSTMTTLLLDALLDAAQERVSMGDDVTARALVRVFTASAEPVWAMVHRWMRDGMPVRDGQLGTLPQAGHARSPLSVLPDEFFVEDSEMIMLDPDFWADGFTLRNTRGGQDRLDHADQASPPASVPIFLAQAAEIVLATGKVTGLLRALGISALFDGEDAKDRSTRHPWMAEWRTFRQLLEHPQAHSPPGHPTHVVESPEAAIASSENLSRTVHDELRPYTDAAHQALTKVLTEDCDLWLHLNAMEDLFLLRRGDAMSHFIDILFNRVSTCFSISTPSRIC